MKCNDKPVRNFDNGCTPTCSELTPYQGSYSINIYYHLSVPVRMVVPERSDLGLYTALGFAERECVGHPRGYPLAKGEDGLIMEAKLGSDQIVIFHVGSHFKSLAQTLSH